MIVLDTNVVSEIMNDNVDARVVEWLNRQTDDVWTTAITVHEIRFGIASHPAEHRQRELAAAFDRVLKLDLGDRVLDFDAKAAEESGVLLAKLKRIGRMIDLRDVFIAGTVAARPDAVLATRNTRHFADAGIPLVDPWQPKAV